MRDGPTPLTKIGIFMPPEEIIYSRAPADLHNATVYLGPASVADHQELPSISEIKGTWTALREITQISFEPPIKNTNQTESTTLSLEKFEIISGTHTYLVEQLLNGKSRVSGVGFTFTTAAYSWKEVQENIQKGYWRVTKVIKAPKKATNLNILSTPELVEVGDTIVFFMENGGVEERRKGIVLRTNKNRALGEGIFVAKNDVKIDYKAYNSASVITGLYIIKKGDKPEPEPITSKNAPVGSLMSYKTSYNHYTNVKTGADAWQELKDGELNPTGLSNSFIDRMIKEYTGSIFSIPGA